MQMTHRRILFQENDFETQWPWGSYLTTICEGYVSS